MCKTISMPSGVKLSHEEFKAKLKEIQPDLELMSVYVCMKGPRVKVKDSLGIEYLVRPQDLLRGKVPSLMVAVDVNKAFELKSRITHGDVYDYSKVDYKTARVCVTITCPIHGDWNLVPDWHIRGRGCPKCSRKRIDENLRLHPKGWSKRDWVKSGKTSSEFKGFKLYILRCWNEDELFYKVGRTYREVAERYNKKNALPYDWEIVLQKEGTAEDVFNAESFIKSMLNSYRYTPKIKFDGRYECFKEVSVTTELIDKLIPSEHLTSALKEMFSESHLTSIQKYLLTKLRDCDKTVNIKEIRDWVLEDLELSEKPSNITISRSLNKLLAINLIQKVVRGKYKALIIS